MNKMNHRTSCYNGKILLKMAVGGFFCTSKLPSARISYSISFPLLTCMKGRDERTITRRHANTSRSFADSSPCSLPWSCLEIPEIKHWCTPFVRSCKFLCETLKKKKSKDEDEDEDEAHKCYAFGSILVWLHILLGISLLPQ